MAHIMTVKATGNSPRSGISSILRQVQDTHNPMDSLSDKFKLSNTLLTRLGNLDRIHTCHCFVLDPPLLTHSFRPQLNYSTSASSNLTFSSELEIPDKDKINQRLTARQQRMKYYHDRSTTDLSPLTPGQPVRIQDQTTKKWHPGTVSCKRPEPRSYEVKNLRPNLDQSFAEIDVTFAQQSQK